MICIHYALIPVRGRLSGLMRVLPDVARLFFGGGLAAPVLTLAGAEVVRLTALPLGRLSALMRTLPSAGREATLLAAAGALAAVEGSFRPADCVDLPTAEPTPDFVTPTDFDVLGLTAVFFTAVDVRLTGPSAAIEPIMLLP